GVGVWCVVTTNASHSARGSGSRAPPSGTHGECALVGSRVSASDTSPPPDQVDEGVDDVVGAGGHDVLDTAPAEHVPHPLLAVGDGGSRRRVEAPVALEERRQLPPAVAVGDRPHAGGRGGGVGARESMPDGGGWP